MCDLDGWMRVEEVLGLFPEYTSSRSASVTEHRRREYMHVEFRSEPLRRMRWSVEALQSLGRVFFLIFNF